MGDRPDLGKLVRQWKGKKDQWLILILGGILLLVIAMPVGTKTKEEEETAVETEAVSRLEETRQYVEEMETRLEQTLSQVEGAGKVTVMLTVSSSSEEVVEKDRETSSENTAGDTGNKRSSTKESAVYTGEEEPYITQELVPEIQGVAVIAQGGANPVVVANITEAVEALFGVETHKIKVMKRSE